MKKLYRRLLGRLFEPIEIADGARVWVPRSLVLCVIYMAIGGFAEETNSESKEAGDRIEQVLVIGTRDTVPGSGTVLDTEELERFDYSDINQVMSAVPGIYIREEDGYGLRPNIGIRGAVAERSLKITIMEDGILIAPAPYSAPAAYYVPNISRISGVEVLKGPAAIQTGPHTVGGAINLVSRDVPDEPLRELDLSYGSDAFYKGAFALGGPLAESDISVLIEGLSYGTDGFKTIDGGGDSGFVRNDLNAKIQWLPTDGRAQQLTLKFAYANEDADETYLGLTDDDFRADPTRRYRSSQLANFQSDHYNLHVNYGFAVADMTVNAKAYWNRFEREWNKVDGFVSGRALQSILTAPHRFIREYNLLIGAANSEATDAQTFEVTNNDREFTSSGVQATVTRTGEWFGFDHSLTSGVRIHNDQVQRDHKPRGYLMMNGLLAWDGLPRAKKSWNQAGSSAVAGFIADELSWQDLTLSLGLRYETIRGDWEDLNAGIARDNQQTTLAPGVGVHWQATERVGLLAGIYRGFSPAGPGATGVDPEQSVNFEAGTRIRLTNLHIDAVAFLSDYENLLGRCRVSDTGCEAGQEFNGGAVEVQGLELDVSWTKELGRGMNVDTGFVYTLTDSVFKTGFLSGFSQWGLVRDNDELPYLPRHRGSLQLGLVGEVWEVSTTVKHQAAMREEPGTGPIEGGLHAESYTTVDVTTSWHVRESTMLQFVVGNALDEVAIVSHRPFGARPNRPRWFSMRIRNNF